MITIDFNFISDPKNIGLGNHMFQYSICRLIAEKNGYNFFIPYSGEIKKIFTDIDLGIKDGDIMHQFREDNTQFYNPEIFNIPDFTNIFGYFQTDKYFQGNENKIKKWFNLELDEKTKYILDKYNVDKYCYIHLRGGDYKLNSNLLPKEYYENAIFEIKKEYNLDFVIITDDLTLANSYFPTIDAISNDIVTDFKCLYFSEYSITSNSSFSWWTSWLTDKKITIAPNRWLNYNNKNASWHPIDIKTDKFKFI